MRLQAERLIFRDHGPEDLEVHCAIESDQIYRAHQRVHPREELERASKRVIEKRGFHWVRSGGDETTKWHDFELLRTE